MKRKRLRTKFKHYYLYALELEHGCFYVGMTCTPQALRRYEQHAGGIGARWTQLHKPIRIHELRDLGTVSKRDAAHRENNMAYEYIGLHGLKNVRGGRICAVDEFIAGRQHDRYYPKSRPADHRLEEAGQQEIVDSLRWIS